MGEGQIARANKKGAVNYRKTLNDLIAFVNTLGRLNQAGHSGTMVVGHGHRGKLPCEVNHCQVLMKLCRLLVNSMMTLCSRA